MARPKQKQSPPLRGQALRDETLNRLVGGEREVLRLLINRYPEALSLRKSGGSAAMHPQRLIGMSSTYATTA